MKLRKKVVSILLACVLLYGMLPAASAEPITRAETYDFTLDTVTAYDSIAAFMFLRSNIPVDEEVTLTITYDANSIVLLKAINGFLYQGDLYGEDGPLQIDPLSDNSVIRLTLNAGNITGPAVVAGFSFGLMGGVSEATIHLEAVTADGTSLSTQDGLIKATDSDNSVTLAGGQLIGVLPSFANGICSSILDNTSADKVYKLLQPASGCSLEAYDPSGAPLADGDLLGNGYIITSRKEDIIVSQAFYNLFGDLDGNGHINALDALLALQSSVGLISLSYLQKEAADLDLTGHINATDAFIILQLSVGLVA